MADPRFGSLPTDLVAPSGLPLSRDQSVNGRAVLPVGTLLGRYRITELIGSGGFADVYAAQDREWSREVALKVSTRDSADPCPQIAAEAETVSRLHHHPSIVTLHDYVRIPHRQRFLHCLVFERLHGQTLDQFLRDTLNREHLPQVLRIAEALVSALRYAAEHSTVHGDVKSHNVYVTEDGAVKVLDFGISRELASESRLGRGTYGYRSRDVAHGALPKICCDVFGSAVVLFEMLTGRLPYAENWDGLRPITLHQLVEDLRLPHELAAMMAQALAPGCERRPTLRDWHARIEATITRLSSPSRAVFPPKLDSFEIKLVMKDEPNRLARLARFLMPPRAGEVRQVPSAFSYLGLGSAIAWTRACSDPTYVVMRKSIDDFQSSWREVFPHLSADWYRHYCSLGPGTGEKDFTVASTLFHNRAGNYIGVDMSPDMLHIATQRLRPIGNAEIMSVEMDFSEADNLKKLRHTLDQQCGHQPILYSLLGNTLGNLDDDRGALRRIRQGMRAEDRLLLEVAITADVAAHACAAAAAEYENSPMFLDFAISSLRHFTHLPLEGVLPEPSARVDRAEPEVIRIETFYTHHGKAATFGIIGGGNSFRLQKGERIRVYLSRKYTLANMREKLLEAGLEVVHAQEGPCDPFGLALLLLRPSGET